MLLVHISIAIVSLIWTAMTWAAPSSKKLLGSYGLIAGTLATGTILVISTHQAMLQACATGLLYVTVTMAATLASQRKLAAVRQQR